jgi:hypothetical protein
MVHSLFYFLIATNLIEEVIPDHPLCLGLIDSEILVILNFSEIRWIIPGWFKARWSQESTGLTS